MNYITIEDNEGILRPKAYLEKVDLHEYAQQPKLEEGESFVEVKITIAEIHKEDKN